KEVAILVLAHQIPGAEPAVALLHDVRENLFPGRFRIGIALETIGGLRRVVDDLPDHLADFAGCRFDHESVRAANRLFPFHIEAGDPYGESMRHPPRNAADGAGRTVPVEDRDVSFSRRIPFENLRDGETRHERGPDI